MVGFVGGASAELFAGPARAFRQGLKETNHEEGRDFSIEERWAQGSNARLPGLVADLVQRQVSVIVTTTTPGALAAKTGTKTIRVALACRTIRSEWCPLAAGAQGFVICGFPRHAASAAFKRVSEAATPCVRICPPPGLQRLPVAVLNQSRPSKSGSRA